MAVISGTTQLPSSTSAPTGTSSPSPVVQKVNIPGDQGAMGINAYTETTQDFTVPLGDNSPLATIEGEESRWMVPGQPIYIQSAGTFVVSSTPNNTTVNVVNPGTAGNAVEGTIIVSGMKIGAGGFGTGGA